MLDRLKNMYFQILYTIKHYQILYTGVPQKAVRFQIQIGALIHTTYCSSLKFIIAFQRRLHKNTQFHTHER